MFALAMILTAGVYIRGWLQIRKTRPEQFRVSRLSFFLLGLAVLWLSLSPWVDELADVSLSAHMVEHLLLMAVVPPLLLLGWPVVPLLRGLPIAALGPLLRSAALRRLGRWITLPPVAWLVMNATFLGWHVPAAYDFALQHEGWHAFEHFCFLAGSSAFWWCVVRPWPMQPRSSGWGLLLYLIAADLVNTALSAFLAFCDRPVYGYYFTQPNPFHLSPLSDQVLGAVLMWVFGSFVFLAPATLITFRLLQPINYTSAAPRAPALESADLRDSHRWAASRHSPAADEFGRPAHDRSASA
jgi:cytochrome c oxidase assembly factor CtaG